MAKKQLLCIGLALLLLCLNLTGCGAGDAGNESASMTQDSVQESMDSSMGWDGASGGETAEEGGSSQQMDKMIYRADMDLETTAFDQTTAELEAAVAELGGYFERRSVSSRGTYRHGSYTIRVPAENFQALLELAGEAAHVLSKNDYADNVSEAYYDLEARLTTQRTKLERLQELLAQAETMEDIITIESAISDTELQIEYLTGSLRDYDSLIDYATVEINLNEVYKLSNVEEPAVGFLGRLGSALTSGFHTGVDALENLVLFLAYNWLFLLALAVVVVVVVTLARRKRRKPLQPPPSGPEGPRNP